MKYKTTINFETEADSLEEAELKFWEAFENGQLNPTSWEEE